MTASGFVPRDSRNAITPQARATSAASAFISEIALTGPPSRSADWKARKPANVPSPTISVQTDKMADGPCACQPSDSALIPASAIP